MAADMLAAYYGCGSETRDLFEGMKIAATPEFGEQLNQYYVIKLDMQMFMTDTSSAYDMIRKINKDLIQELITEFPEVPYLNRSELPRVIDSIYQSKNRRFVILLDEWDCVMRRYHSEEEKKRYLDFLRNLMKDQPYIALAYMTGILPVKKYGEHSTLNMFDEFSMVRSLQLVPYFGFTETEVKSLCERYAMNFEEAREWYDGYHFAKGRGEQRVTYSMYSPKSVVDAMLNEEFDTYWTQTESYEALRDLIQMNFDGLQDDITEMLAGNSVSVNTRSFQNDMSVFHGKDDVLTLLIHLGYLSYNSEEKSVCIPNKEVAEEFIRWARTPVTLVMG